MKSDRGKALLSREASGYFSQKVAAPTPKGIIFLCKILGNPLLEPPSYLCEGKSK